MARTRSAHAGSIQERILLIRGVKVIVDADLAKFYGVETKRLNQQVTRNARRFPADFQFRLTRDEKRELVAKCDHLKKLKHSRALPRAFTEHGALMAASVLNTTRAVEMSVFVVRAFVNVREAVWKGREVARRLDAIEARLGKHGDSIEAIVKAIRKLMAPDVPPETRRIGFRGEADSGGEWAGFPAHR